MPAHRRLLRTPASAQVEIERSSPENPKAEGAQGEAWPSAVRPSNRETLLDWHSWPQDFWGEQT